MWVDYIEKNISIPYYLLRAVVLPPYMLTVTPTELACSVLPILFVNPKKEQGSRIRSDLTLEFSCKNL